MYKHDHLLQVVGHFMFQETPNHIVFETSDGDKLFLVKPPNQFEFSGKTAAVQRSGIDIMQFEFLSPILSNQTLKISERNTNRMKLSSTTQFYNVWCEDLKEAVLLPRAVVLACYPEAANSSSISTWIFLQNLKGTIVGDICPNVPNQFGCKGYQYRVCKLKRTY